MILMIDDDAEDIMIMQDALAEMGTLIVHIHNGIDAINYLRNAAPLPSIIVLDLNMPRMNGTQTLQVLKRETRIKNIPVVIYSTSINKLEKDKCMALGAHDFIIKPYSLKETMLTAQYFIKLCQQQEELLSK